MAYSKKNEFQDGDLALAEAAKAMGHPARIAILRVLAERDTCICGEIVDVLPLAQSNVSQHLKALKAAGLIEGAVDGPRTCYCLNRETLQRFSAELQSLFEQLNRPGCC